MKDSGIEWIGAIPRDWYKIKFKYVFDYQKGKKPKLYDEVKENVYPYISMDVQRNEVNKYQFAKDDVGILGEQGNICVLWDGSNAGEFYKLRIQGIISSTSAIILSDTLNPTIDEDFLFYYLKYYETELKSNSIGMGIPHVDSLKLKNDVLIHPALNEQKRIVLVLDNKTKKIEEIKLKTEQSIVELKKYRQSLITEFVTKGLDPNVEFKDSKIGWIDKTPKHWQERKLKYIFNIIDERNSDTEAELLSLYTSIGVKPRSELEDRGNKAQTVINYKIVKKNDLVVNRLLAWMGAVAFSDYDGVTSPDYDVYRINNTEIANKSYFNYFFRYTNFKEDCYRVGRGIMLMRWRTYPEQLLKILVPLPPLKEQQQIVSYLDEKVSRIDKLIEDKTKVIEELENYKKSLIYEYVTGKKEV